MMGRNICRENIAVFLNIEILLSGYSELVDNTSIGQNGLVIISKLAFCKMYFSLSVFFQPTSLIYI